VHDSHNQLTVEPAQICFFRDQLRSARAVALADAEGFHAVLRVVELIAQQLDRNIRGLGHYKTVLSGLASASPLAADLPSQWPAYHTEFGALFDEMRQARNDAVHQGAYARTLTDHAVELSIILEDALMTDASKVSQFMVRDVVDAKPWHPVSYVRQQMLTHAFSYLPIWDADAWKLIPEYAVARLLRNVSSAVARRRRLAALVSDSIADGSLELLNARTVSPKMPITEALQFICERPVLVVDRMHADMLVGLVTSSDIL
jgi:predicted transcriptional regulator